MNLDLGLDLVLDLGLESDLCGKRRGLEAFFVLADIGLLGQRACWELNKKNAVAGKSCLELFYRPAAVLDSGIKLLSSSFWLSFS